jgi:hypothetical protein
LTSKKVTNLIRLKEKLFDLEYKEKFVEWIDEDE